MERYYCRERSWKKGIAPESGRTGLRTRRAGRGYPAAAAGAHYTEIYVEPWQGGDPQTDYLAFVAKANAAGYQDEYREVAGRPAIVVPAHSKGDVEEANPAFIRFVVRGVEVQVSGGEDLEQVVRIAEDLVDKYERS